MLQPDPVHPTKTPPATTDKPHTNPSTISPPSATAAPSPTDDSTSAAHTQTHRQPNPLAHTHTDYPPHKEHPLPSHPSTEPDQVNRSTADTQLTASHTAPPHQPATHQPQTPPPTLKSRYTIPILVHPPPSHKPPRCTQTPEQQEEQTPKQSPPAPNRSHNHPTPTNSPPDLQSPALRNTRLRPLQHPSHQNNHT
ncbi:hypothetical protein PBY51_019466 [Eleginops maclovinus]|uniref:Uncharacterized protein n=1 Tax=Eleginops maclovinus TaxID=56733 RepID=A0AAN8AYM8_ELEMC|nr:hypothetical protein PBY51_019466 [Eleginops maclovinus]